MTDRPGIERPQLFSDFHSETVEPPVAEGVMSMLGRLFPYMTTMKGRSGSSDLAPEIYDALAGTSRMRISPAPNGPVREANLQRIRSMVEEGLPISASLLYGTAKFPRWAGQNKADLADFAAVQTLEELNRRVESVYEPGITVRYYMEDVGGFWLFGDDAGPSQEYYLDSLEAMMGGHERIFRVRESDMLRQRGLPIDEIHRRASIMEPLFDNYFADSEEVMDGFLNRAGYDSWEAAKAALVEDYDDFWQNFADTHLKPLESYQQLIETGWQGYIPPEMREFYLDRFKKNLNNAGNIPEDHQGQMSYMAHYFALVAAKAQVGLFTAEMPQDAAHDFDAANALKLSFIKLAPGVPFDFRHVLQNRVLPKPPNKDREGISLDTAIPPWRGVGGVLVRPDGTMRADIVAASGVDEYRQDKFMTVKLQSGGIMHLPVRERASDSASY